MVGGECVEVRRKPGIAGAEDGEAHRDLIEQRDQRGHEIDPLLMGEAGDDGAEQDTVVGEPDPLVQRRAIHRAGLDRRSAERRGDQRIGGRIPHVGVDPVQDADQVVRAVTQCLVESEATFGRDDLGGVVRRHGHDAVGERHRTRQRVRPSPPLVVGRPRSDQVEPRRIGGALVCEVVDRKYRRWRVVECREHRTGVPVVEMQDIGRVVFDERGHRPGEAEEPLVVVGPALAAGPQVRMWTRHSRHGHQVQPTDDRMETGTNRRRTDPVGNVETLSRSRRPG